MGSAFTPVAIGPVTLRNRFIRSGANEMMTYRSRPTQSLLEFHRRLAAGGVGMTTLAYVAVSPDGRTFASQGVLNADSVADYRAITDAVHAEGALASAQITHGGSFVQHKELSTPRAMSSSGGIDKMGVMMGRFFQRQMNRQDMDQVRDEFVAAARHAVEAGFDAVELHMGHGYLLNQYISPLSNKRRDDYGGTAEKRARFPAEVLAAVKQAVGDRIAVLAKINLYDGAKGGATVEDGIVTAKALEAAGADMLVLSGGRNIEASYVMFSSPLPYDDLALMQRGFFAKLQFRLLKMATPKTVKFSELYFLDAARRVRASVKCKLGYLGGVLSLDGAEKALAENFDAVVMARSLVHDPALVSKWQADATHRSACDACNRCVAVMYGPAGTYCTLSGNAIDPKLNKIYAGEELNHAA